LVTAVFSDLSGYTAMSEKLDPEDIREITEPVFEIAAEVIERYGGLRRSGRPRGRRRARRAGSLGAAPRR
jgi:class 3 adenylate cyclase